MVCVTTWCLVAVVAAAVSVTHSASTPTYSYEHEKDPKYWRKVAAEELRTSMREPQKGVAKNVILFLGDGMGPTSVTAGRILAGQSLGKKGEEHKLSFDDFPYTGLSRTYNTMNQITDSSASGTAYLTGVKTGNGIVGLNGAAKRGKCETADGNEVESIVRWALKAGKSAGIVTTTRITHATPASAYAHSVERNWESDRKIPTDDKACPDIARQLMENNHDINVIMGGGRAFFYPENVSDPDPNPEFNVSKAERLDGRDLVKVWEDARAANNSKYKYVFNKTGFDEVDPQDVDYLLGLFNQDHMNYELDRDPQKEPSIAEMTLKAIQILSKNKNGYFLLVEGGRIDHGHHESRPALALNDVVAMAEAVEVSTNVTNQSDTLIVVTADHSHTMSIAGYASRGNPILGISDDNHKPNIEWVMDHKVYTTLVYGNGPGYVEKRPNVTPHDVEDPMYQSQSAVPMYLETHGGEDVAIYARGPQSYLYTGVHEQNYIPMVMAYASCIGPYADQECASNQPATAASSVTCENNGEGANSDVPLTSSLLILTASVLFHLL